MDPGVRISQEYKPSKCSGKPYDNFTNCFNFVDLVLIDKKVEERVQVVEKHDHFRRLNPGADGGEANDVAEEHRYRWEHLARVHRVLTASNIQLKCLKRHKR